jgi:hypothetical protein
MMEFTVIMLGVEIEGIMTLPSTNQVATPGRKCGERPAARPLTCREVRQTDGFTRLPLAIRHAAEPRTDRNRHSIAEVMRPLEAMAAGSPNLVVNRPANVESSRAAGPFPSFVFLGPAGGGDPIRVGLFAGIHGDEPEGVRALVQFLCGLERQPEPATGYCLFVYPICNPTGFEDGTRLSRSGSDLNREFWKGSPEPEVHLLESELRGRAFHGLISLHTDDTSDGFYGYAHGPLLTRSLVEPALRAAERFLPRNRRAVIDGFPARDGIIGDSFDGVLRGPPEARPRPFEITLETPQAAPAHLKEAALVVALQTILTEYRQFIAYAPGL